MIQLKSQIKKFGLIFFAMLIGAFQSQAAKTHLNMGMVLEPPHLDPTAGAAAAASGMNLKVAVFRAGFSPQ